MVPVAETGPEGLPFLGDGSIRHVDPLEIANLETHYIRFIFLITYNACTMFIVHVKSFIQTDPGYSLKCCHLFMLVNLLFEIFTPIHIKRNSPLDSIQQSFPTSENPMKRQDLRHYLVHHQRQRLAESWSLKRQKLGPMMVQVMSMSGETKVSW